MMKRTSPNTPVSPPHAVPTSILTRKRDLIYLAFFLIHIPVMLCIPLLLPLAHLPIAFPAFLNPPSSLRRAAHELDTY